MCHFVDRKLIEIECPILLPVIQCSSTYSDLAPIVILLTLVLSFVVGRNITERTLEELTAPLLHWDFYSGFSMTCMNLVYTSNALFC